MTRPTRPSLPLALAALLSFAAPAHAQVLSADSLARNLSVLGVSSRPWSTVVVVTVLLPSGSSDDPAELSGASRLLAELVRARFERQIRPGDAVISVDVDRTHTIFQALAAPDAWLRVYDELLDAIFNAPLQADALEAERRALIATARFESGAPVREFQDEFYELIGGTGPWSRDPSGTEETLEEIGNATLSALRGSLYRRAEAVVTLVGALGTQAGVGIHPGRPGGPARTAGGPSWSEGRRERLARPVTNSWIGAAFPVPAGVPRTLLDFIRHRVGEELNPEPPDPGLFGAEVRIEEIAGGTVLLVEAAVLPEAEERWEERVVSIVQNLGRRHEDPGYFRFQRRRFRTALLVGEGAPEVEGLRIAMDLLVEGAVRDLESEIYGMDPPGLARAVDALGEPRVLVFGPDLAGGGG